MKRIFKILVPFITVIFAIILIIAIGFELKVKLPPIEKYYYNKVHTDSDLEKKYSAMGKYQVSSLEFESGKEYFRKYKVWYPSVINKGSEKYPLVVMVNGTELPCNKYEPIFEHLSSWGFVVIGNDNEASGDGKSSALSLDLMLSLNDDSKSIFYNKIDTKSIGISGYSQGGCGAIHAISNFENGETYKTIYLQSAVTDLMIESLKLQGWQYDISKINIPIFMTGAVGELDEIAISPLEDMQTNFDNLNDSVAAVMARRKNSDHGDILMNADGYMTAWFRYILMDDKEAAKVFEGNDAEIITNTENWQDVQRRNIKKLAESKTG